MVDPRLEARLLRAFDDSLYADRLSAPLRARVA